MKVFIFIIFYIFTSIFYVLAKDNQIDSIKAIVNNKIIFKSDIDQVLLFLNKDSKNFGTPLRNDFLEEKIVHKLIADSLILEEANRMNITITQEQINTVIKNIALKKNISVNELKNYINQNSHIYYENYINNIKNFLKIKKMQDYELRKRINISEEEVNFLFKEIIKNKKKFQKINLSYMLLPCLKEYPNNTFKSRRKLAESIVNKLQKGYDFEKLLIDSKKNKSIFLVKKMFWMHFLDLQNNFSKTLDIFKKGQILGPFFRNKGFYILKVNDIKNSTENIVTELYMQHCLIKPSIILTDIEAKKSILNIYEKIQKGVYSFDYAVKNLSNDSYSSNKKGDLGWISSEFFNWNKELLLLKKNEISKPIKSNFGWHIFKLLDTREVDQFYNFKKKEAYNILFNQKMILEKNNWIEDLKKIAYIKIIKS